ncbi:MAG: hypothetical protein JWN24_3929 [Phycisphaerales bacterium]|nr:hypothetical protein [Phycisphaerales bacterium]
MRTNSYSELFFANHVDGSLRSAREIIPLLFKFVRPQSVVDVGCGLGAWLAIFGEHGVTNVAGIDVNYIDRSKLMIRNEQFFPFDLSKRFSLDRRFDLVISLEVAEHLPASSAEGFVSSLVSLGKLVLFSAAIPGQGGTNHLNEQWPSYWEMRFLEHGYERIDCLRPLIWENDKVQIHYRQNAFIYAESSVLKSSHALSEAKAATGIAPMRLVHPSLWEAEHLNAVPTLGSLFKSLPGAFARAFQSRVLKNL